MSQKRNCNAEFLSSENVSKKVTIRLGSLEEVPVGHLRGSGSCFGSGCDPMGVGLSPKSGSEVSGEST